MSKETPLFTSLERLEELQEGTRAAPKESELCLTLGEAFLRVGRVDEAAASYQRAVELDPRSDLRALYWEWLGLVREMEGRLEEALEAYFQWVDADPVAMSPLDRLSTLLVVLGRWTDLRLLRPQYTRRSEVAPTPRNRESLALYTFVTEQLGEQGLEQTREATMAGLESDPDSPALRFLLGLLTYQEGQLELSRGEFERVLELDSDGLWQEQRFALDWNGAKARVMVAKLARLQGDLETALGMLENAEDLDRSDSEGLTEAAELLLENGRYEELIHLLSDLPSGPSRVDRLKAEALLGRGQWGPARRVFDTESALLRAEGGDPVASGPPLRQRLSELWQKARSGEELGDDIAALRREAPTVWEEDPLGASLMMLHRARQGALSGAGLQQEMEQLCGRFPEAPQVWELAELVFTDSGDLGARQLSALARSKLEHGTRPGPTGVFATAPRQGTEILVTLATDSAPLILKLEAEVGREARDQLFGWGQEQLRSGLELAKGVLEDLGENGAESRGQFPELSLFPRSFRVMTTPLSHPPEPARVSALMDGDLGSVPFAMLVALMAALRDPLVGRRLLVLGRLGLRGNVHGVAELEETLLTLHHHQIAWDHLVLASAGAFRLMRCPSWLWYERPLTLIETASDLFYWAKAPTLKGTRSR
jgi:tetratricopeptide (TPR) repeat protein